MGGPEVLQWEDVKPPKPGEGEVLVRVRAASVNPVDYKIRSGAYTRGKVALPATLGRDDDGKVAVDVEKTFPLKRAREAHEEMENEHTRGKVVLEVS